jgi:hypothetical protein
LGWGASNQYKGKANLAASKDDALVLWMGMEGCQMTKDFYFNTAEAMDKAKADRDKPVTPVEYIPVISDVGSDSNMLWPDTPFVPKKTGKITLLESKPNTWVMRITADRRIEVNEDVEVTEAAQKVLDAMRCLLAALPARGKWVGLTDEEKRQIFVREGYQGWLDYINAIEAKLKEKNNG